MAEEGEEEYDILGGPDLYDNFFGEEQEGLYNEEPQEEKIEKEFEYMYKEVEVEEEEFEEAPAPFTETKTQIHGDDRITEPFMTKYEYCRLIDVYAQMLADGAPLDPRVPITSDEDLDIAEQALDFRAPDYKFPLTIKRPFDNNSEEVWYVEELITPKEAVTYGLV